MPSASLSHHDIDVLQKIKDPESGPSSPVLIDASLPRDPHILDASEYENAASSERQIILEYRSIESRMATNSISHSSQLEIVKDYDVCTSKLADLIMLYPKYASAHNNMAQALRRRYGESLLLHTSNPLPGLVESNSNNAQHQQATTNAAVAILKSLKTAIELLTPLTYFAAISPQAAKTLSQAYTQRGALFYTAAKQMGSDADARIRLPDKDWGQISLEEMASRDFMMGARYGNELAKRLAVATNPTAKLCGNIVMEAMKKEFEGTAVAAGGIPQ
jgi:hypothetical protein